MNTLYPSEMAVRAFGIAPQPKKQGIAEQDTCCAMCGRQVRKGEVCDAEFVNQGTFMDDLDLAVRGSQTICQWCGTVKRAAAMPALKGTVVCKEGVLPIRSDAHRSWFLLTPPEPPFVALIGITQNQHLVWRTPVTLSRQLITVRVGEDLLTIRQGRLQESVAACRRAGEISAEMLTRQAQKHNKKAKPIKPFPHPFMSLDRDGKNVNHGVFRPTAVELGLKNAELQSLLDFLACSTKGELWALATLAKTTPDTPVKPEPLTLDFTKPEKKKEK